MLIRDLLKKDLLEPLGDQLTTASLALSMQRSSSQIELLKFPSLQGDGKLDHHRVSRFALFPVLKQDYNIDYITGSLYKPNDQLQHRVR